MFYKTPISNPTILIKQNGRAARTLPFHLVRMTGFEPTRISSLEPDGNVTSVETPVPMLSLLRVYYSIKAELNQAFSIVLLSFLTNYCL